MKNENLLIIIILIGILIGIFIFIKIIKDEKSECIKNPIVYGIKSFESAMNQTIVCSCISSGNPLPTIITNNGFNNLVRENKTEVIEWNLTLR